MAIPVYIMQAKMRQRQSKTNVLVSLASPETARLALLDCHQGVYSLPVIWNDITTYTFNGNV